MALSVTSSVPVGAAGVPAMFKRAGLHLARRRPCSSQAAAGAAIFTVLAPTIDPSFNVAPESTAKLSHDRIDRPEQIHRAIVGRSSTYCAAVAGGHRWSWDRSWRRSRLAGLVSMPKPMLQPLFGPTPPPPSPKRPSNVNQPSPAVPSRPARCRPSRSRRSCPGTVPGVVVNELLAVDLQQSEVVELLAEGDRTGCAVAVGVGNLDFPGVDPGSVVAAEEVVIGRLSTRQLQIDA